MFKIISPEGVCAEAMVAIPYNECSYKLGNRISTEEDVAGSAKDEYTGIKLLINKSQNPMSVIPSLYIGNLTPEKAKEIMQSLYEDGKYDFSQLEYQERKRLVYPTVDGGKSKPYYNENIATALSVSFIPSTFGDMSRYDFSDLNEED